MTTSLYVGAIVILQLVSTAPAETMAGPLLSCQHPRCQFTTQTNHSREKAIQKFIVEEKTILLSVDLQTLDIYCQGANVLECVALPRAFPPWNISKLALHRCPLPDASTLNAGLTTLNVALQCESGDQDSLCELYLVGMPSAHSLAASHFLGLEQLQKLSIDVDHPMTPERNFLAPLQNLSTLILLRNVILPSGATIPSSVRNLEVHYAEIDFNVRGNLPVSSSVETLSVYGWRDPEPQPLSNCEALRELHVFDLAARSLPDYWVANCSRLEHLHIIKAANFTAKPKLLFGASALINISFVWLELGMLPVGLLDFSPNLQSLRLAMNHLHTLPRDLFASAVQVRILDLSHNDLRLDVMDVLQPLEHLTYLDLSSNPGFDDICEPDGYSPLRYLSQLNILVLSDTGVRRICRDWLEDMPRLEWLNLSRTNLSRISFQDLQFKAVSVQVHLWDMHLKFTPLAREEFVEARDLKNHVTVYINKSPSMDCSCDSYWTWRTLQLPRLKFMEKMRCTDGRLLRDVPFEEFWCQRSDQCAAVALPAECSCESRQVEDPMQERWIIRAHCENGSMSTFPSLPHNSSFIYDLYLAHNNITEVLERDLQHDIGKLDLSNNPILVMDDITAKRLDNVKGILRLAGNQMNCSCSIMPLLRALQTRRPSMMELNEASCSDGRTLYAAFSMDCSSGVSLAAWLVLVIVCLASALVLGAAAVSFFWSRQRRFFARAVLHRWGWTRRAEENDDRRFDAFLTFSHRDSAAARAVMARLEPRYRLCVHVRDWTPGELILAQIVESVQDSRRTVALVSRHFLASKWARAEFREAHLAAMLDERPRLVVVLLEDPRELRLEEQLSGYIATRTYLRWGEALFWDKLAVALPPPRLNHATSVEEQKFEL